MSARRDVLFHLVLACAGLGLAAWATAEPDAARRIAVQHKEKRPELLRAVSTYVQEQERAMIDAH